MTTAEPALAPKSPSDRLSVAVLTGFLGSGKTTLLNRLLKHPALGDTAVIVNEFGEVGVDHALIEKVDSQTVLLESGCVCCTVRDDLVDTLRDLLLKRAAGQVTPFVRVVIETTGLADPVPIIHVLQTDPVTATNYRLDSILTTVDALHGAATMSRQPEAIKQAALADTLVITKTDLLAGPGVATLESSLRNVNPAARLLRSAEALPVPDVLFEAALYDPASKSENARAWLRAEAYANQHAHAAHVHGVDVNRHGSEIEAFCIWRERPLSWSALSRWLEQLNAFRGDDLLRVKGLVNVEGFDGPFVVHGVQQMIHVPTQLSAWPDDDRRTRMVFITRGIEKERVEATLAA